MRTNSILSNLTAGNTVSEIRLILASDTARQRVVVLLEGEDDVKLFKFLVRDNVTLIKAYGACTSIDTLIPEHFESEPRVIAVRDRDYTPPHRHPRIFYCDHSCAEMMVVSDDETFDKITTNHYRGKLSYTELRLYVLSALYYVSLIRKISYEQHWGLRIGDTDLPELLGKGKPTLRDTVLFLNLYNKHNLIDERRQNLLKKHPDNADLKTYLDITNGHDFAEAMAYFCVNGASNTAKKRMSGKVMSVSMRLSYSRAAFKRSKLYAALKRYGKKHGLLIV